MLSNTPGIVFCNFNNKMYVFDDDISSYVLGKDYRERIYREFLGIEPPQNFEEGGLK
jgi:hypothetical protein